MQEAVAVAPIAPRLDCYQTLSRGSIDGWISETYTTRVTGCRILPGLLCVPEWLRVQAWDPSLHLAQRDAERVEPNDEPDFIEDSHLDEKSVRLGRCRHVFGVQQDQDRDRQPLLDGIERHSRGTLDLPEQGSQCRSGNPRCPRELFRVAGQLYQSDGQLQPRSRNRSQEPARLVGDGSPVRPAKGFGQGNGVLSQSHPGSSEQLGRLRRTRSPACPIRRLERGARGASESGQFAAQEPFAPRDARGNPARFRGSGRRLGRTSSGGDSRHGSLPDGLPALQSQERSGHPTTLERRFANRSYAQARPRFAQQHGGRPECHQHDPARAADLPNRRQLGRRRVAERSGDCTSTCRPPAHCVPAHCVPAHCVPA